MSVRTSALLLLFLLFACAPEGAPIPLPARTIQVAEGQSVRIRLNEGEMVVQGGETGQLRLEGQTSLPDQTRVRITTGEDRIEIDARYTGKRASDAPIHLEIRIPEDVPVRIETDTASIIIRDYRGALSVESVSGEILIENSQGNLAAHSNRGDVKVQQSAGQISLVGNYGLLTVQDSSGDIGASTIMGTITYSGLIRPGDNVRLETDHGPVSVNLSPDSALTLQVRSTSGDVTCLLPDLSATLRSCDGALNAGGGALRVRTVSGAATLQLTP